MLNYDKFYQYAVEWYHYFLNGGNQMFEYMHKDMVGYNSRSINQVINNNSCIDSLVKDHREKSESHRITDT